MEKKNPGFSILILVVLVLSCSRKWDPLMSREGVDSPLFSVSGPSIVKENEKVRFRFQKALLHREARLRWRIVGNAEIVQTDSTGVVVSSSVAASHFFLICEVISPKGKLQGRISRMIRTFRQAVILKADDFIPDLSSGLATGWKRFIRYVRHENLRAAVGVVGRFLENPSGEFQTSLLALAQDPRFELWNHGYYHSLIQVGDGRVFSEFFAKPYSFQREALRRTQLLMRKRLGYESHAFGAPGNLYDRTTMKVLRSMPDIHVWFFGQKTGRQLVLPRTVEVEYPAGEPDFSVFVNGYHPDQEVVVLQIHPAMWDERDFGEFVRIVEWLRQHRATFVLPEEYFQYRVWCGKETFSDSSKMNPPAEFFPDSVACP